MHEDTRWRLICYDVRDPRRWRKLYKIVRGYGVRLQYSVFRARLDERELERMRWELAQVLSEEDSLIIIDLCPACAARVVARNQPDDWDDPEPTFAILP